MAITKIKIAQQALIETDVDFTNHKITNLASPVADTDAVNKAYVDTAKGLSTIGASEDGTYTDGLFTDFTSSTPTGTAIDRFNEVLKSLSPQPAPNFSSMSCTTVGVSGRLSFGASNAIATYTNVPGVDVNGNYTASGTRLGIINASTAVSGVLANNVTPGYTNSRPYPNLSFGDANTGNLILELNGVAIKTVDLLNFNSGTSLSANGSGFNLSAATAVAFTNGDLFPVFKYRTGTWTVTAADQRKGYNTVTVKHEYATGLFRTCQTYDWVVDGDTATTTFTSESLGTLAMTGSRKISGVEYHTGGTAKYGVTINNGVRNTYSVSASAVNYNGTNVNITDEGVPVITTEADAIVMSNKTATVNATRLLNGSISVNTTFDRTVQSDVSSTGASISGLFVDSTADSSTTSTITFNGEGRRIHTGLDLTSTAYGAGAAGAQPSPWDSLQSLIGADANHNTGLQVYNGTLIYPKTNFSTITNGPASNVNYSGASGNRTFLAFFYNAAAYSNFRFNVTASSTTFVTVATGPSANNLTFEVLAPNTTKNGAGTVVFKDAVLAHSGIDTDAGCFASTYGAMIPTAWGCTLGTKNTSTAGNVIVVKITASAAWTGSISQIAITWL